MKSKSIMSATATVLFMTIFAKIIGFCESAIVAAYFGTSPQIDMFYMANSISNHFVFIIFSGFSVVGITMYDAAVAKDGKQGGNRFISALVCVVIPIAIMVSVLIYLLSPYIAKIMTANYTLNETKLLTLYLRELGCVAVFYALTTIFVALLNANKIFFPGALLGAIQNGTMIIFVVMTSRNIGENSVVVGFVVSYILQTIFLYVCAKKIFSFQKCNLYSDINIKKIVLLLLPLILGEATGEVNILVDQYLATIQGTGYVSGLAYSETLNDVVTALFIKTVTSVLLAFFSEYAVEKRYKEMLEELKKIMKIMIIILVPITIVTVTCPRELVSFVFERGNFTQQSVEITALALIGYGYGFIFKTLMVIAKRPFFAIENTRIPMIVGIVTVVMNISLSVVLSNYIGILGITMATSIAYAIASMMYFVLLKLKFKEMRWGDCKSFLGKICIGTIITSIITVLISKLFLNTFTHLSNFVYLMLMTVICFGIYFGILKLLRLEELTIIIQRIFSKLHSVEEKR